MKKVLFFATTIVALTACNSSETKVETVEKQQVATIVDGKIYTVDASSTVTWTGSKPTGKHSGTFSVKEGSFIVKDNTLVGGKFTIDINSLNNQDLATDTAMKAKLEGHLKSSDFFDVAKYPTANFEITEVQASTDTSKKDVTHIIKGNLTLKDSTKNISIPARVTVDAATLTATADFSIDRTLWGMSYKGPNNPQDWVISKAVGLKLDIRATKK